MKITFRYKNKKISLDVQKCNFFQRLSGLMFRRREKARSLLFDFRNPTRISIHSLFVFFPFVAIWLDNKNEVMEVQKVASFRCYIFPRENFYKLIEIPINKKYSSIVNSLVGDAKDLNTI